MVQIYSARPVLGLPFAGLQLREKTLEFPLADGHIEVGLAHLERKVRSLVEDFESSDLERTPFCFCLFQP